MSSIGLVPATLTGLVLESCLTGIALVMFVTALYVLANKGAISSRVEAVPFNRVLFAVDIILMICVLAHWITNVSRAFDAFIYDSPNPGAMYIFGDLRSFKSVFKTSIFIFEVGLADSVLIYRTYKAWDRKLVIVFPVLTTLGAVTCGVTICVIFSNLTPETPVFANVNGHWILGFCTFTLLTNLYCSPAIAYRIWISTTRSRGVYNIFPIVRIILESAIIYTMTTFFTFILYICQSNIQAATLDATSPIIGIVFCLITVRVELGVALGSQPARGSRRATMLKPFGVMVKSMGSHRNSAADSSGQPHYVHTGTEGELSQDSFTLDTARSLGSMAIHITREVGVSDERTEEKHEGLVTDFASEMERGLNSSV